MDTCESCTIQFGDDKYIVTRDQIMTAVADGIRDTIVNGEIAGVIELYIFERIKKLLAECELVEEDDRK